MGKGAIVLARRYGVRCPAPRGSQASLFRLGNGIGLGQRLATLKAKKFGAVHADVSFIKADSTTKAFSFDRGQVTAASETSVTLKRADGPSVTKSISADTKVRGKLAVGGKAVVFSQGGGDSLSSPPPPRPNGFAFTPPRHARAPGDRGSRFGYAERGPDLLPDARRRARHLMWTTSREVRSADVLREGGTRGNRPFPPCQDGPERSRTSARGFEVRRSIHWG